VIPHTWEPTLVESDPFGSGRSSPLTCQLRGQRTGWRTPSTDAEARVLADLIRLGHEDLDHRSCAERALERVNSSALALGRDALPRGSGLLRAAG
jgi:hypothetical protein